VTWSSRTRRRQLGRIRCPKAATRRKGGLLHRALRVELLEDRRLLSITVDTLTDELDGSIVDGDVSLRDAIAAATPSETIDFSVTGTIALNLTLGELVVNKDLTISGPGADLLTIDAGDGTDGIFDTYDGVRIFNVDDGNSDNFIDVELTGLTLTGGDVAGDGGAIWNCERLVITASTISDNAANDGGGIYNWSGEVTVVASTISGNSADSQGGAICSEYGSLTLSNSTVSGNSAYFCGGGIYSNYGQTSIRFTTITGNAAGEENGGGGIASYGQAASDATPASTTATFTNTEVDGVIRISIGSGTIDVTTAAGYGDYLNGISDVVINLGQAASNATYANGVLTVDVIQAAEIADLDDVAAAIGREAEFADAPVVTGNETISAPEALAATVGLTVTGRDAGSSVITITSATAGAAANGKTVTIVESGTVTANAPQAACDGSGNIIVLVSNAGTTDLADVAAAIDALDDYIASLVVTTGDGNYNPLTQAPPPVANTAGGQDASGSEVYSTIVAGNTNGDVEYLSAVNPYESLGYNLIGTGNATDAFVQAGDQVIGTGDPGLGPLQDNGGPTWTHALLATSPAIDAGDPSFDPNAYDPPLLYDQRGAPFVRVADGDPPEDIAIDIGAFELVYPSLFGDYNLDNSVDAADYCVWRDHLGASVATYTSGDGTGDGFVDENDYVVWKAHFGQTLPPPGSGAVAGALSEGTVEPAGSGAATASQPPALPGDSAALGLESDVALATAEAEPESDVAPALFIDSRPAVLSRPVSARVREARPSVASRQDDLLLAWSLSRTHRQTQDDAGHRPLLADADEPHGEADDAVDALDAVFETLGG
jgi:hypothetical protein